MKKSIAFLFAALLCVSLVGCRDKNGADPQPLDPIETAGVPYEKKPLETVADRDFEFDIYTTFAAVSAYKGSAESVTVPSEINGKPVLSVGDYSFAYNTSVKRVTVPEGVREIGKGAFDECTSLESISLPSTLETVLDYAFRMTALDGELALPKGVARIGTYAFYLTKIEKITIPDGVEKIERYAFYGIDTLKSVTLGIRVTEIEERAFGGCTALCEFNVNDRLSVIGNYSFNGCAALESITLGSIKTLGEGAFSSCGRLTVYTSNGKTAELIGKAGYKCELTEAK